MPRNSIFLSALVAGALVTGCKSAMNTAGDTVESAGEAVADGAEGLADGAVSLVNVDLSNVLNDLALDLNIDRANIPINAQVPITIAANVCGVSINILSVSTGGETNCTATSTSPELTQVVQQQLAAGGNVGGGGQTTGAEPTGTDDGTTTQPDDTTDDPASPQ
jgi:hypothetical protein